MTKRKEDGVTREIRRGPRGVTLTQMPETGALESGGALDTRGFRRRRR